MLSKLSRPKQTGTPKIDDFKSKIEDFNIALNKVRFVKQILEQKQRNVSGILNSFKNKKNIWFGEIFDIYDKMN